MEANILVVDDDDSARTLLATMLQHEGHRVTAVADGATAIDLLGRQDFDLVLSDIRLGSIDGLAVLHAARREPTAPEVILLTGYGSLDTAIQALRHGAADYLLKPCPPDALLACVTAAMQRRTAELQRRALLRSLGESLAQVQDQVATFANGHAANGTPPAPVTRLTNGNHAITIGDLLIGSDRRHVFLAGRQIHVTPVEYALLRCLGQAAGEPVSYSEIVGATHGYAADGAEAVTLLKAHVRNLRRKLPGDYLVNVRRTGYRLSAPETLHHVNAAVSAPEALHHRC